MKTTMFSPKHRWLILLALVGALFISVSGWSVYRALTSGSHVTDPDYDHHGQRYARSQKGHDNAKNPGWTTRCSFRADTDLLEIHLTGVEGAPVTGASARLEVFHGSGSRQKLTLTLEELDDGVYSASLPEELSGEVGAMLSFRLGAAFLRKKLVLFI